MSRLNLEDNLVYDPTLVKGIKGGVATMVATGAFTLDRDTGFLTFIDPGGATRVMTLPAAEKGLMFWITNTADAAEDITVSDPLGPATRGTISQNEAGLVYSDGVRWYVAVGTTT
jgi:hypothetical protein